MKLKVGDPITTVLLAPDPYELIDARVTFRSSTHGYAEWSTVGLVEQRAGVIYDRNEDVDWARGHGDDVRAMLLLLRSAG